MQIVDRYLKSVKTCLPAAQADDIAKELSENIYAQIEDKENELQRSLTEAEVEAILKQHGHPLLVASRYRQEQRNVSFGRQIIGPALFPLLYPGAEIQPGPHQRSCTRNIRGPVCRRPADRQFPASFPLSTPDSVRDCDPDLLADGPALHQVPGSLGSTQAIWSPPPGADRPRGWAAHSKGKVSIGTHCACRRAFLASRRAALAIPHFRSRCRIPSLVARMESTLSADQCPHLAGND